MENIDREAIQKSLDARAPRDPEQSLDGDVTNEKNINWHITNYPPFLNAFHWNLAEVNKEASIICFIQRIVFGLATLVGLWNLIQTIVMYSTQPAVNATVTNPNPGKLYNPEFILGGALLMIIMFVYGLFLHIFVFYCVGKMTSWYFKIAFISMGIYALAFFICGIIGSVANFEGYANLLRAKNSPWLSTFWITSTLVEASLWISLFVVQLILILLLRNYKKGYAAKVIRQRAINEQRYSKNKGLFGQVMDASDSMGSTSDVTTKVKNKIFGKVTKV